MKPQALVVIDATRTATAEEAGAFVELEAALDFEALWALRALVAGAPIVRARVAAAAGSARDGSRLDAADLRQAAA